MRLPITAMALALLASAAYGQTDPARLQKHDHFVAALKDSTFDNTAQVMITVIDEKTGRSQRVCNDAGFLIGALTREQGISRSEAIARGAQNTSHTFHFNKEEAIRNILPSDGAIQSLVSAKVCEFIAEGFFVRVSLGIGVNAYTSEARSSPVKRYNAADHLPRIRE